MYRLLLGAIVCLFSCLPPAFAAPDPRDSVAIALRAGRYHLVERLLRADSDSSDSASNLIRRGIALLHLGNPRAADSVLALAKLDGVRAACRDYWRATAQFLAGDAARATEEFERLCQSELAPVRDSAQVWSLRCAIALGDGGRTERAISRLVSRSDDLAAVGLLAKMRRGAPDWEEAWLVLLRRYYATREAYEGAFVAESLGWRGSGDDLVVLARMYVRQDDPAAAVQRWYLALEDTTLAPRRPEIRYRLAELLSTQRQYREAEQHLRALLADSSAQSFWPSTMRLYALVERRRNNEPRTRYWERRFAETYPDHEEVPEAIWNIAMSWDREGNCTEAVKVYEELATRFPEHPRAEQGEWRVGFCAYRARRYREAQREFSRLARSARDYVVADQAGYWSGLSLYAQGWLDEAHREWDRAAAYSPRSYYAIASALACGRPVVPPEDERPIARTPARQPESWPNYDDARWLSSMGQTLWARAVLTAGAAGMAQSMDEMEALADAFESLADYPTALAWRWRAMWRRTTEDRYHELPPDLLRRVWPDFYRDEVLAAARQNHLDPALVWAIIRVESVFNPEVTSQADARGLMQIVPATGRALAQQLRIDGFTEDDLYDPGLNIRLGTRYVAQLLGRFKKIDLVAAAYNAGPSNVRRWQSAADGDHDVLRETITYSETRRYVKLVLRNYLIYRSLYHIPRGGTR